MAVLSINQNSGDETTSLFPKTQPSNEGIDSSGRTYTKAQHNRRQLIKVSCMLTTMFVVLGVATSIFTTFLAKSQHPYDPNYKPLPGTIYGPFILFSLMALCTALFGCCAYREDVDSRNNI